MLQFDSDSIYVESTAHLEVLCDQARHARRVGVDLEFIRERSYFAKLALVQIAVEDSVWLIDPLHDAMDLAPLESLMEAPEVCKIMHAPDQDLEIFFHRLREVPRCPEGPGAMWFRRKCGRPLFHDLFRHTGT